MQHSRSGDAAPCRNERKVRSTAACSPLRHFAIFKNSGRTPLADRGPDGTLLAENGAVAIRELRGLGPGRGRWIIRPFATRTRQDLPQRPPGDTSSPCQAFAGQGLRSDGRRLNFRIARLVGNLTKADRPNTRPTEFSSESTVDEPHEEPVRRRFSRFAQAPKKHLDNKE
jgi:hypothetical protein